MILSTCRKPLHLFAGKKSISSAMLYWRYCKDMQTSYFGYFGHARLHTPKLIASTYTKTMMFICMQKTNFIIHFILEILHFKESYNLIGCSNLRTRILPDMRLVVKYQQQYINNNSFHFRLFPRKFKDKISKKSKKNLFWDTLFTQIRAKMNCPGKKSSVSF